MSIHEKLIAVQSKLNAPKKEYNKFGKYSYRSCEGILEALKPLLLSNGLSLVLSDELVQVGERYYIKATAVLIDKETAETIQNTAYAREALEQKGMDAAQITGTASSYSRKYALNGLFLIDDNKDPDSVSDGQSVQTAANAYADNPVENEKMRAKANAEGITEAQLKTLKESMAKKKVAVAAITGRYKVKALEDLKVEHFMSAMRILEKMPDKE